MSDRGGLVAKMGFPSRAVGVVGAVWGPRASERKTVHAVYGGHWLRRTDRDGCSLRWVLLLRARHEVLLLQVSRGPPLLLGA